MATPPKPKPPAQKVALRVAGKPAQLLDIDNPKLAKATLYRTPTGLLVAVLPGDPSESEAAKGSVKLGPTADYLAKNPDAVVAKQSTGILKPKDQQPKAAVPPGQVDPSTVIHAPDGSVQSVTTNPDGSKSVTAVSAAPGGGYVPTTAQATAASSNPFDSAGTAYSNSAATAGVATTRDTAPYAYVPSGMPFGDTAGNHGLKTQTIQQAQDALSKLKQDDLKVVQQKLVDAGYLPKGTPVNGLADLTTQQAYASALLDASQVEGSTAGAHANGDKGLTVNEYLDTKAQAAKDAASKAASTSLTSTHVDLSSPTDAQAFIVKAFQDHFGQAPTSDQIAQFTQALNSAQTSNPSTTSSQTTVDASGAQHEKDSSTTKTINPGQFADNYAVSADQTGAGDFAAATTYYSAALQAIGLGGR